MIAEVIVDIVHSEVDKVFDYEIGDLPASVGYRVTVPFGNRKIDGIIIAVKQSSLLPENKIKKILTVCDEFPVLTEETLSLVLYIADKYKVSKALSLRLFLPSEMRRGRVSEKTVDFALWKQDLSQNDAISTLSVNAKNQRAALQELFTCPKIRLSQLRSTYGQSAVKNLIEKNLIEIESIRVNRLPYSEMITVQKNVNLMPAQVQALNSVNQTEKTVTLIHGVTGSGKTEVYLNLIQQVIESGKTAIMLVPEISLTPQMLTQLRARFNELCAILHSGLSSGERFDEWCRLRSGEAKIAIGARSAIFAPLENLGMIIIDEEHDSSYDSETVPRYSTLDIALFRAKSNKCKLVLGSATPSIETYTKAISGTYNLVKMPERINKKPLPEVLVADMRQEVRRGNNTCFSAILKDEIDRTLKNGNQVIIFLNRRGYSQQVICRECGYVAKCITCDVSLNYHRAGNLLKCHYCGTSYKMLTACPECGSTNLNYIGTGTQKIVTELKQLFPDARIIRMDNDTTSNKDGHYKILSLFARHEADILVGTQMIAKGHDFPHVTLVGILDADMSLHFSDYRSSERTYQLLTQVAGRSGRADDKGTVVLQTYSPNNPVLKFSMNYDYDGFYKREIAVRKATKFPPFSLIIRVLVESAQEEDAINGLKDIYLQLKKVYEKNRNDFLFFNKMKSPIKRIKNKFRYQVLMRIKEGNDCLRSTIFDCALQYRTDKVFVTVEENPSNLS